MPFPSPDCRVVKKGSKVLHARHPRGARSHANDDDANGGGFHGVAPFPRGGTEFGALVVDGDPGALLTVREVADRLQVSRATVYRLVLAGALPVLRVSNAIRIPDGALVP